MRRHGLALSGRTPWRRRLRRMLLGIRRWIGLPAAHPDFSAEQSRLVGTTQPGPGPHATGLREDRTPVDPQCRPRQGRLGDCWVMASLLAIHEQAPGALLDRLTIREDGTAEVRLGASSSMTRILVDRWMPVDSRGRWVYATQSGDGPGWVGLFEKALAAHLSGSYGMLARGIGRSGLRAITGEQVRLHVLLPSTARIRSMLGDGRAVLASTHPLSPLVRGPQGPFPANHVMVVVGADPVTGTVQLRNPWRPDDVLVVPRGTFRRAFLSMDVTASLREWS